MIISEHNELKEQFGRLGLNLISKAEKEIMEMKQNTLFQKSQIKKTLIKRNIENALKTKTQFIEIYNQLLNNALASILLKIKYDILEIKNKLLKELRLALLKRIESSINSNYDKYIAYLVNNLKKCAKTIKHYNEVLISLNKRDYKYFSENSLKLKEIFKTQITIQIADDSYIGGFTAYIESENASYNFTIRNYILKQSILVESAFSEHFSEETINELIQELETFVSNKKENIEEHLKEYDRIG